MIGDILAAVKEIVSVGNSLRKRETEKREQLASYLDSISACLSDLATTATNSSDTAALTGRCAELEVYGEQCAAVLESALPNTAVDRIIEKISQARRSKELLANGPGARIAQGIREATYSRRGLIADDWLNRQGAGDRAEAIANLNKAAGRLKGLAVTLRTPIPTSHWRDDGIPS